MSVVRAFLAGNRRVSAATAGLWPHQRDKLELRYCELVARRIRERPGQLVVDVGGGKSLRYAEYLPPGAKVVAVDLSEDELSENQHVTETRIADVTRHLPFLDAEVDVLTSSSVLEHLDDIEGFLDEAARVIAPGGAMIHLLPSRYATFAILNRALPERIKRRLLFSLYPGTEGFCGFPAHYNHCYYSAIVRDCERRGFRLESVSVGYYGSSDYYSVFFPVFLLSLVWEMLVWTFRLRNLGAQLVVEAMRLPDPEQPGSRLGERAAVDENPAPAESSGSHGG